MNRTPSPIEKVYRQWARDNYTPGEGKINPAWHPIIIDECNKMLMSLYAEEAQRKLDADPDMTEQYYEFLKGIK
jgi:hypothetical protein